MKETHKDKDSLIEDKILQKFIELSHSINYYCQKNTEIAEQVLSDIDRNGDDNPHENLTPLEVTSLHSLYLRVIGYAMLSSVKDIFLAEKISRRLGVDLIQEDISKGRDVPSDIVDSMLDEINRTKNK